MADRGLPRAEDRLAPDRPLTYREWGAADASPLLFWPALSPTAPSQFDEAGPVLAERFGFRVLAVSPPGWETPPLPVDEYRPTALAGRIVELADRLGFDRVAYVGASWGASVGCHVAAVAPERVSALVLLDAGYTDFQDVPGFRDRSLEETVELLREQGGFESPEAAAAAGYGVFVERPSSTLPALAEGDVPILLLAASVTLEQDWARLALERFRTALARADVRTIASGHNLLAEAPVATTDAVGAWLEERRY